MTRKTWKDVDWVELGCRGWDIDETGAELSDGGDWNVAHLDFKTLRLHLFGDADFVERAIRDLRAANALTPPWTFTGATSVGAVSWPHWESGTIACNPGTLTVSL